MMTFHHDMERVDHDIEVRDATTEFDKRRLTNLRHAIRHSWMAAKREAITAVHPSDTHNGAVYAVSLNRNTPPTAGGYSHSIARYGWAYVTFDTNTVYLAQAIAGDDGYALEGRDESFDLPAIRRVPTIPIGDEQRETTLRDERRMDTLRDDLQAAWPVDTLETIRGIKPHGTFRNSYIIETESGADVDEDKPLIRTDHPTPDVPLGTHVDALLERGWGIVGVHCNKMAVALLKQLPPNKAARFDAPRNYMFEGTEQDDIMYLPNVCGRCEKREGSVYVVIDEREAQHPDRDMVPVTDSVCNQCYRAVQDKYLTRDEYREAEDPQVG